MGNAIRELKLEISAVDIDMIEQDVSFLQIEFEFVLTVPQ